MSANQNSTNLYLPTEQNAVVGTPSASVSQTAVTDASGLAKGLESFANAFSQTRSALQEVEASQDLTLLQQDIKTRGGALELQLKQVDAEGMVDVNGARKSITDLTNEYTLQNQEAESSYRSKYNALRLANYTTQSQGVVANAKTGAELLRLTTEHGVLVNNTLVKEEAVQQSYLQSITPASTVKDIEKVVRQYGEHMKGLSVLGLETTTKINQSFGQQAILSLVESAKTSIAGEVDPEKRLVGLNALEKNLEALSKSKELLPYLGQINQQKLGIMDNIGREKEAVKRQKEQEFNTYLGATLNQAKDMAAQAQAGGYTPGVLASLDSLKRFVKNKNLDPMQRQAINSAMSSLTLEAWGGEESKKLILLPPNEAEAYAQQQIKGLDPKDPYYMSKVQLYSKVLDADQPAPFPNTVEETNKFVGEHGMGALMGLSAQTGTVPRILFKPEWVERIKHNAEANSMNGYAIASDINGAVNLFVQNGLSKNVAEVKAYQEVASLLDKPWLNALAHVDVAYRGKLLAQALGAPSMDPAMRKSVQNLLLSHKGEDGKLSALGVYANRLNQNGRGREFENLISFAGRVYYSDATIAKSIGDPNFSNPSNPSNKDSASKRQVVEYFTGKKSHDDKERDQAFLNNFNQMLRPPLTPAVRGYDPNKPAIIPQKNMASSLGFSYTSDVHYNQNTVAWLGGLPLPEKAKAFKITSAYRDAAHNASVGGAPGSSHVRGLSLDLDMTKPSEAAKVTLNALAQSGRVGQIILPPSFNSVSKQLKASYPSLQIYIAKDHADHVHITASESWKQNTRLLSNYAKVHTGN